MTNENPLVPRTGTELAESSGYPAAPPQQKPTNLFVLIHSLLRGRYPWAITLGLLGLMIGGVAGFVAKKPEYRASGYIHVKPVLPKILYQTEQNSIMPMFDQFMAGEVARINSRRVVEKAMGRIEWKSLGRGNTPESVAEFEESLRVDVPRGSALIQVSFRDRSPNAAMLAVQLVIEEYKDIYEKSDPNAETLSTLEDRRKYLDAELNGIEARILAQAKDFGSSSLQSVYAFKLAELNRVESQLRSAEIDLLLAGGPSGPSTAPGEPEVPSREQAVEALAKADRKMLELRSERDATDRKIRVDSTRLGANHREVVDARASLQAIDEDIQRRYQELDAEVASLPAMAIGAATPGLQKADQLRVNVAALKKLYADLKIETVALGQKNLEIEGLRNQAQEIRERLADTKNRQVALEVEQNVGGRLQFPSQVALPFRPENDKRIQLSVVGAMGLGGLGVGVIMLMGLLDRRMQHVNTATSRLHQIDRLLGVVPELPNDLADPEEASSAAYCVHHIRAMLQIRQRATGRKTFALTSPSPGDGKTSIAITVGMSLASSGCNTLLIDCDMEGAGLSSRMGRVARRPLGQVLLDMNLLGEAKLEEALRLSQSRGMLLGHAVVQLGYLTEQQVADALKRQGSAAPGLGDVLCGEPVERAITGTGYPMLSILPLGVPAGTHAGRLSPEALRRVLDRAASKFDIILLDCGPILGSVEAAIVAAEADSVVLVVSRGGDRTAAENGMNFLIHAGAEIEGIIFNRAQAADVAASAYHSSHSLRSARPVSSPAQPMNDSLAAKFHSAGARPAQDERPEGTQ